MKQIALLAALLATLPLTGSAEAVPTATTQPAKSREQQVDTLFAKWNRPGTPGAVVEVIRDGKVVLSRGYGMADLERGVPMTKATRFTIGSNSKQFTAFSIHLLEQDGKLSLDDDIRKYLPEVPQFGKKITIRHLLHHTSGLRDYFNLMLMTGWRIDDVITEEDALALVKRQRALNFEPGQEHLYSNTGYMLLAQIVQRISGQALADFARARIFEPLGMKHTRFVRGYGSLVPGRALSYLASANGGYEYVAVAEPGDGAGGIVTTAGDLALWDRNFYDGRVGGKALIANMQATGVLNDGSPINYASGLLVDTYRGRRIIEHGGTIGGFQTQLLRFPDQRVSVILLANTSDLNLYQTVRRIADIYLERELDAQPAPPQAPGKAFEEIEVAPAQLEAVAGYYALSPESGINFTLEDGRLMAQGTGLPKWQVFAYGERKFFTKEMDAQFTFDPPGQDGIIPGGVLHQNGADIPARRVVRPVPSDAELKQFEGEFYSDELHALYSVAARNGGLVLTSPRRATIALDFNSKGEFATGTWLGYIKYQCSVQDGCTGFTANNGRVRNLQFTKVALVPPGARVASPAK
jgi:CubicO group peptidase (beta-lactamase class C family)